MRTGRAPRLFVARAAALVTMTSCSTLASLALATEASPTKAQLSGQVGQTTSYFLDQERVRHHQYKLRLKQVATLGEKLTTVVEGWGRVDAAVHHADWAPQRALDKAVRDDEYVDAQFRELTLDYLGEVVRWKVGRQPIDWVDSLAGAASDLLTPMDLRFGGLGGAGETVIPVDAILASHLMPGGALEYVLVPRPSVSRLPKGDNGYGYSSLLREKLGFTDITEETQHIPLEDKSVEAGVRYIGYVGGLDLTLLAYHGHVRRPVLEVQPTSSQTALVTSRYPRVNTLGASTAMSTDEWVLRAFAYHEPNRPLRVTVVSPPTDQLASPAAAARENPYETRTRIGLGADYAPSRHFKFYGEAWQTTAAEHNVTNPDPEWPRRDIVTAVRLTNESWDDWILSLEGVMSTPERSTLLAPQATITFSQNWKIAAGARLFASDSEDSVYASQKDASHVYCNVDFFF